MGYAPYGSHPDNDPRVDRRERAIEAEAQNVPMADLLDFIAFEPDAQGYFEALLQEIRNNARTSSSKLSSFLDCQAIEYAQHKLKRAA